MSTIIFVGDRQTGYFAEEVAKTRNLEYRNVERKARPSEQINDILFSANGKADYIIFDVEQYICDNDEIVTEIKKVCKALNAKPIIYAPAFLPSSELTRTFIDSNIKQFIISGSAASLKDQLEKNITGYYNANERNEIEKIKMQQEEEKAALMNFKTIGIAGTCHRIGTTTQALQAVKYLTLKGYKACFLEFNENKYQDRNNGVRNELGFVEKVAAWFESEKTDKEIGLVRAFGIDMYYKQSKIPEILKMGYDYFVYDYGCYTERGFNKTSFVREDIKIFVTGASVTELDFTKDVAENLFYQEAKFVFSLTSKEEEDDLIELMESIKLKENEGNAARTYFAGFSPDPFSFTDESAALYEKLIPVENLKAEKPKNKGLFKKRGK